MSMSKGFTCALVVWATLSSVVVTSPTEQTGRASANVDKLHGGHATPSDLTDQVNAIENTVADTPSPDRDLEIYQTFSGSAGVCPQNDGSCFESHNGPGCDDEQCCNKVCGRDFECCAPGARWDSICVGHAEDLCGCAGEGSCFVANGTPGCEDDACCALVCDEDSFCCDSEWDCKCAETAAELCGDSACPSEKGGCLEEHNTPGCTDEVCCSIVCSEDPLCCKPIPVGTGWDPLCVDRAATLCAVQGDGDCMFANGTPGCDTPWCAELVCAEKPWCCQTEWGPDCADAAGRLCSHDNCPGTEDCLTPHPGEPGCADELCCNSVCLWDQECCQFGWHSLCAEKAAELCVHCPGDGACDIPNSTPGCENTACCVDVCAADPLCCEVVWDAACAAAARDLCRNDACPGKHPCFDPDDEVGCADEDCCNAVCLHDFFCCSTRWDGDCVDVALRLCTVRNDTPADVVPVLTGGVLHGSTGNASPDPEASLCDAPTTAPGVWYRIIGTGSTMTIDACSPLTGYDTRISVFSGDCPRTLTCIADNDNTCGLQASVTWASQIGETYFVLVHGAGTQAGDFELTVWGQGDCPGDSDADQDVDLADFANLQRCFTGPRGGPLGPDCECADLTDDENVDRTDLQVFSKALNGP